MQDKSNNGGGFLCLVLSWRNWQERQASNQEVASSSLTEGNYFENSFLLFLSSTLKIPIKSDEIPVLPVPYSSYELYELNGGEKWIKTRIFGFYRSVVSRYFLKVSYLDTFWKYLP